jgi:hypothetical protein
VAAGVAVPVVGSEGIGSIISANTTLNIAVPDEYVSSRLHVAPVLPSTPLTPPPCLPHTHIQLAKCPRRWGRFSAAAPPCCTRS